VITEKKKFNLVPNLSKPAGTLTVIIKNRNKIPSFKENKQMVCNDVIILGLFRHQTQRPKVESQMTEFIS
jgi:hypothetical protein